MGIMMVFLFAGLAVIFLFVPVMWENFTGTPRKIFGIALVIYAFFRAYRIGRLNREYNE
jgi:predicted membrane chloride channel (bestrophin family)